MEDKKLTLKVLSPNKTLAVTSADFVLIRTTKGDMGVKSGHEPYLAAIDKGYVRSYAGKELIDEYTVLSGFIFVRDNVVVILSVIAAEPEKLADTLAEIDEEREKRRKDEEAADLEMHRAEEALRHTLVLAEISPDSIIKGHLNKNGEA